MKVGEWRVANPIWKKQRLNEKTRKGERFLWEFGLRELTRQAPPFYGFPCRNSSHLPLFGGKILTITQMPLLLSIFLYSILYLNIFISFSINN